MKFEIGQIVYIDNDVQRIGTIVFVGATHCDLNINGKKLTVLKERIRQAMTPLDKK